MGKGQFALCRQHVSVKLRHHHDAQTSSHKTHTHRANIHKTDVNY